jgi:hypothetical protein
MVVMADRHAPECANTAGSRKDEFSYPPAASVSLFLVRLTFGTEEREEAILDALLLVPLEWIAAQTTGSKVLTYQEWAPVSLGRIVRKAILFGFVMGPDVCQVRLDQL